MSADQSRQSDTTAPWPDPPELAYMTPQFRLGYRQAQSEAAVMIERLRAAMLKACCPVEDMTLMQRVALLAEALNV